MNRLRRMVLVNSAKVRYREVELDGHIHFIGTQGTGKSTVLRALLFFYHADSRRLGISKEKKPFAEYYFPYADSYIFYEVQAGARRFCVWLYKRQNRLCFRFVDGGYEKEWVIEGNAARDEAALMAKAGALGLKVERAIHNFTEYRDILYGENRSMRRYALMQGVSNYSTIPRTISNIFLNANLDGGYIKKTMIDSLSDEAVEINLETNRHHLDTARSHYADVAEYLANESAAEQIVETYASVVDLEERQRDVAWKIGAAVNRARELVRGLEERIAGKTEEEQTQREKLKQIQSAFETDHRRLGDQLAVVKKHIKHANERKRHYAEIGIEALLQEAEALPGLEQSLSHCCEQRSVLTAKAEQQDAKFQIALQKLENERQARIQQLRAELSDAKDANRAEQDAARQRFELQVEALLSDVEVGCRGLKEEGAKAADELKQAELELRRLDQQLFFEEERAQLLGVEQELAERSIRLEEKQKRNQEAMAAKLREAEDRQALEKMAGEERARPLQEERNRLREQLAGLQEELGKLSGSLLEFLDDEVAGWRDTIGKTVRREVLLLSGLEPKKADGRSLFGVELKLEHLEGEQLSKTHLEEAVAEAEKALAESGKTISGLLDANRAAADRLLQKYNRAVKALQDEGKSVAAELFAVERDIERQALAMRALDEKTAVKRQERQESLERQLHAARSHLQEVEQFIATRTATYEAGRKRAQDDFNRSLKQLAKALKQQNTRCEAARVQWEKQCDEQQAQLNEERKAALEKAGVDGQKVAALDRQVQELEERLKTIRGNETVRIEFAKDQREWMGRLPEFKSQRAQLEQKQTHLTELFERRRGQEKALLKAMQAELNQLNEQMRQAAAEVAAFSAFEREELFPVFEAFIRHHDCGEEPDCRERITELTNLALKSEKQVNVLKDRVSAFSGRFTEGNCLGFEVHLAGEAAFRNFAEGLAAFVREQRIVTLKTEVTKKYSMVLNTIVTETNRLLQREGEVNRVIQKMNSDFRASNFVGVVHSIEMRILESSNRIFQVLREICRFQAEHHMSFGEMDLFNRGDSGNDDKAVELLDQLRVQMSQTKNTTLRLEDALELEFRVCENENDTHWVNRLANVGSNGTDVLVKSMIYINLLHIFKTGGRKLQEPAQLHCLVDEVGILHDSNVKSLIEFAAERNICMVNGSPNSHNESDYRHIYMFRKKDGQTAITKLLSYAS